MDVYRDRYTRSERNTLLSNTTLDRQHPGQLRWQNVAKNIPRYPMFQVHSFISLPDKKSNQASYKCFFLKQIYQKKHFGLGRLRQTDILLQQSIVENCVFFWFFNVPMSITRVIQNRNLNSRHVMNMSYTKKSPTGPTEPNPKPEYLITLATYLGVHW